MVNPEKLHDKGSFTKDEEANGVHSTTEEVGAVNASGHADQLKRQYGLLSICATALSIDNAWVAFGGTIVTALANGGPPGVIWELLVSCILYGFIAASIAELASSMPTSGGVYHWASVTSGKYGRPMGFFTGSINFFGWIFGLTSIAVVPANVVVQMYVVFHPDFMVEAWHIFTAFVVINILCLFIVVFLNRTLPMIESFGMFMVVVGGIVTIIVLAAVPKQHASAASVFTAWDNETGWPSGVAFLTGMLNGAFTIGTPDSVTHMAEELPYPRKDLPKAIAAQMILGTLTSFLFAIVIMFAISDLDGVLNSNGSFPLAAVYAQATGNKGGTFALLLIVFMSIMTCVLGTYVSVGRNLWALARDNATPFSGLLSQCSVRLSCPIPATVLCFVLVIGFGAVQLGSKTAFNDLIGSFIILTTSSYLLAILSHLLSGRSNVPRGPFWMKGALGFIINGLAVASIVLMIVMFCMPYFLPVDVQSMNYSSVILVGWIFLTTVWWFVHARSNYPGPKLPYMDAKGHAIDVAT